MEKILTINQNLLDETYELIKKTDDTLLDLNILRDINLIQFFTKKNLDYLDNFLLEDNNGVYLNLNKISYFKTILEVTKPIGSQRTLMEDWKIFADRYLNNLRDVLENLSLEVRLFLDEVDRLDKKSDLYLTLFIVTFVNQYFNKLAENFNENGNIRKTTGKI